LIDVPSDHLRPVHVTRLDETDLSLIAAIDRSEHVDVEYEVTHGRLTERPVTFAEIPAWEADGSGPHSVAGEIAFCASLLADGGILLAASEQDGTIGLAIVDPEFEGPLARLGFLYVSRPHRRLGAAGALWTAAVDLAVAAGATSLYVSAVPTGSAVGFYLSRGCVLADPPHPALLAAEPDDVHLVCPLR
jgi:GNAT superfamily N-acetyltransferase